MSALLDQVSDDHSRVNALALLVGNGVYISAMDPLAGRCEPLIKDNVECGLQRLRKVCRYLDWFRISWSVTELYFEEKRAVMDEDPSDLVKSRGQIVNMVQGIQAADDVERLILKWNVLRCGRTVFHSVVFNPEVTVTISERIETHAAGGILCPFEATPRTTSDVEDPLSGEKIPGETELLCKELLKVIIQQHSASILARLAPELELGVALRLVLVEHTVTDGCPYSLKLRHRGRLA
jgi:hypothetical protein